LHENGCPWNALTCRYAASGGCLKYLHENGCPWNALTCRYAASGGCLKYAHENGCSCNDKEVLGLIEKIT
jgi:hypothetical protein